MGKSARIARLVRIGLQLTADNAPGRERVQCIVHLRRSIPGLRQCLTVGDATLSPRGVLRFRSGSCSSGRRGTTTRQLSSRRRVADKEKYGTNKKVSQVRKRLNVRELSILGAKLSTSLLIAIPNNCRRRRRIFLSMLRSQFVLLLTALLVACHALSAQTTPKAAGCPTHSFGWNETSWAFGAPQSIKIRA